MFTEQLLFPLARTAGCQLSLHLVQTDRQAEYGIVVEKGGRFVGWKTDYESFS